MKDLQELILIAVAYIYTTLEDNFVITHDDADLEEMARIDDRG